MGNRGVYIALAIAAMAIITNTIFSVIWTIQRYEGATRCFSE